MSALIDLIQFLLSSIMYILSVKPIQGGNISLYFFDTYRDLYSLYSKHFYRGYSCRAYDVPRSIDGISLLESVFGTVPYKITDAFSVTVFTLSEYLSQLELSDNLIKIVL